MSNGEFLNPVKRLGWIYLVVALIAVCLLLLSGLTAPHEITWNDFNSRVLARHAVKEIVVMDNRDAQAWLKPEFAADSAFREVFRLGLFSGKRLNPGPHYHFTIGSVESFERKLEAAGAGDVPVRYQVSRNFLLTLVPWLIPVIMLLFL